MAQDLLTKESPEIIRFFQDIEYLTRFLDSEQDRYRPVLNGERYITEAELAELLKITRRTLIEHRTTGLFPYYRLGARKNRLRYGVYRKLPQLLVSNMFIKYNANGEPISYTSADIRPNDLSTNAFGAGAYAKTGAKNYAIRQVAGYRVGLFALEGEESYGYCKNSDLTRMDCADPYQRTYSLGLNINF